MGCERQRGNLITHLVRENDTEKIGVGRQVPMYVGKRVTSKGAKESKQNQV